MNIFRCTTRVAILALAALATVEAQEQSPSQLAITNVRIFTGEQVIERATIAVKGGKVVSISENAAPAGNLVIDGGGMTALPGLIDAHVHLKAGMDDDQAVTFMEEDGLQKTLEAFLRHGVTTVRSLADPADLIVEARRDLQTGMRAGPRLLGVGEAFTAPGGHPAVTFCRGKVRCAIEIDSEEEARREVRRLARLGVDGIKLVNQGGEVLGTTIAKLKPEVMRAVVAEARLQGLPVVAHVGDESGALEALAAGVNSLSHMPIGRDPSNALTQALTNPQTVVMTTLFASSMRGGAGPKASQVLMELYRAGVPLVVGSDSGPVPAGFPRPALLPGESTIREIEALVELGLPAEAALEAATSVAARHLGLADEIGKLAPGMSADILLVRGNPLQTISDLGHVQAVIQAGEIVFQAGREP